MVGARRRIATPTAFLAGGGVFRCKNCVPMLAGGPKRWGLGEVAAPEIFAEFRSKWPQRLCTRRFKLSKTERPLTQRRLARAVPVYTAPQGISAPGPA